MKKFLLLILCSALLTGCKSQGVLKLEGEKVKSEINEEKKIDTNEEENVELVGAKETNAETETYNEMRSLSLELNKEEQEEREKLCRSKIAEYEINFILEMLEIRKWEAPAYSLDEMDMPTDEPLGCYSKEKLESYLGDSREIEVKIFYLFGGHQPWRPEDKFPLQIIKIYEQGKQIQFGYAIWRDESVLGLMVREFYQLDEIEREKWESEREERTRQQKLNKSNSIKQINYKGDTVLGLDNIEEVIEQFATIKKETELYILSELPLTKRFFDECVEEFPYAFNAEEMKRFWFYFYGLGDDNKIICLYILSPYTDNMSRLNDEHYIYSIEMDMQDGKIDSMDITLLQHYLPE